MKQETREALQASIAHWIRMRDGERIEIDGELEYPTGVHCALCQMFNHGGCIGCPVAERTGLSGCGSTPFLLASIAWIDFGPDSAKFRKAAAKEVAFLESLLDDIRQEYNVKKLIEDANDGWESLLGERITIYCAVYIYCGKLVGVNDDCVKLEDAMIVYETGPHQSENWSESQPMPGCWFVAKGLIESFGKFK